MSKYALFIMNLCVLSSFFVLLLVATDLFARPLDSHLAEISGTDLHYGYLLETGDDALLARLYLIRNARKSIDIQTFIWEPDASGTLIFAEILNAARRGVRVRLLIDDLSLRKNARYVAFLASVHPHIQLKQYNPLATSMSANLLQLFRGYALEFGKANQRMHTKVFLVDDRFGITGGRNHADDYFDRGKVRSFKDRDLLIVGNAVKEMAQSFEEYWSFELSVSSTEMKDVERAIEENNILIPEQAKNYLIPPQFMGVSACAGTDKCFEARITEGAFRLNKVRYIADSPGKRVAGEEISASTKSLWQLIESVQQSMTLQTPYFVVGPASISRLKKIREKNPDLVAQLSTNSLAASDHFYAYAYSYKNKKNYLKDLRLEIFEFKPVPTDIDIMVPEIEGITRNPKHYVSVHAKTFIFDSRHIWLGTFNLDRRSATLNTEAGLVIDDATFAQHLEFLIKRDSKPRNAWTIGPQLDIPVVSFISGAFESVFRFLPFINVWPFRSTTSYELKSEGEIVPMYDERFPDNYRAVGQFPGKTGSVKALQTRLMKAFLGPAEPII